MGHVWERLLLAHSSSMRVTLEGGYQSLSRQLFHRRRHHHHVCTIANTAGRRIRSACEKVCKGNDQSRTSRRTGSTACSKGSTKRRRRRWFRCGSTKGSIKVSSGTRQRVFASSASAREIKSGNLCYTCSGDVQQARCDGRSSKRGRRKRRGTLCHAFWKCRWASPC